MMRKTCFFQKSCAQFLGRFATLVPIVILGTGYSLTFGQTFEASVSAGEQLENNANLGTAVVSALNGYVVTYGLTNGFNLNFRATLNTWKFFGHEFGYAYNRTHLDELPSVNFGGMAVHQGFYDFLGYALPQGSRMRPFAAVGVHFSNYVPPGETVSGGQGQNKFGVQYGGGVKLKIAGPWGIRFDVHQFTNGKPFNIPGASGWIRQTEISGGVDFML